MYISERLVEGSKVEPRLAAECLCFELGREPGKGLPWVNLNRLTGAEVIGYSPGAVDCNSECPHSF